MVRKLVALIIVGALLLSIAGCGKIAAIYTEQYNSAEDAEESIDNETPATDEAMEPTEPSFFESGSETAKKTIESGILALYTQPSLQYNYAAALVWIDPDTGEMSLLNQFVENDSNIKIYPRVGCPLAGTYGKRYLLQAFDSTFERIVAHNTETDTWGWMDTAGKYTDVTGLLPTDASVYYENHGIGFYGDYYYFSSLQLPAAAYAEYSDLYEKLKAFDGSYSYEATEIAYQMMPLSSEIEDSFEYNVYKVPINDCSADTIQSVEVFIPIDFDDFYMWEDFKDYNEILIQGDGATEKAYLYRGGSYGTGAMPVFYNGLSGMSVPMDCYSDWVNSNTAIRGNGGTFVLSSAIDLNGKDCFEVRSSTGYPQTAWDISMESNMKELINPIVSPDASSFACINTAFEGAAVSIISLDPFADAPEQTVTYTSDDPGKCICIYSLDTGNSENPNAEEIRSIEVGAISISGVQMNLNVILDWTQ